MMSEFPQSPDTPPSGFVVEPGGTATPSTPQTEPVAETPVAAPAEPAAAPAGATAVPPDAVSEPTTPVIPTPTVHTPGAGIGGATEATTGAGAAWPPPPGGLWPLPGGHYWSVPPQQPAPKHHSAAARTVLVCAVAAVIALGAGIGIGWFGHSTSPTSAFAPQTNPFSGGSGGGSENPFSGGGSGSPLGGGSGNPFSGGGSSNSGNSGGSSGSGGSGGSTGISSKVDPGLVDINTTVGYQGGAAAGTGMVLTSDGLVLTNNHVINESTKLSAVDVGNGQTYSATVLGYDRTADVALVQLHNASGLQTITASDSSKVSVGDDVVGIGNAGGTGGTPSAVAGTITALDQSITASDEGDGSSEQLSGLIQTNADIQPGDSGGPLVNSSGQVVGMDTAASAGFQFTNASSTGFAIPIDKALQIAQQIKDGQTSSTVHIGATAFLGVEVTNVGANSNGGSGGFGLPFGGGSGFGNSGWGDSGSGDSGSGNSGSGNSTTSGAQVAGTMSGGAAAKAGLVQGDVITSLDGKNVNSPTALTAIMEQLHPGQQVSIAWTDSSGQSHTGTVTLGSGPPS
jgi:S1-C subfamily serine protease